MQSKEYKLPNGKTAVFEYDVYRIGKVTLESMDELMSMIADRPQGEWITEYNGTGWNDYWDYTCTNCKMKFPRADDVLQYAHYCPSCGARMKGADDERHN